MLHCCADRIKSLVVVVLMLASAGNAFSQTTLSKKQRTKIRHKAENHFDMGDYWNALKEFDRLYALDSLDPHVNYHMGVCKFYLRRFRGEALNHMDRSNSKVSPEYFYYSGLLHHLKGDFDLAELELKTYLHLSAEKEFDDAWVEQLIANIATARELRAVPVQVDIKSAGESINTSSYEYVPLISADGQRMFFTARREGSTGGKLDEMGDHYEDIYLSINVAGEWQEPIQLPAPVNTGTHDACVGLTPEGESLLMYRTNPDLVTGSIFITSYDGKNWTEPVLLDPVINAKKAVQTSASMSASGEFIIFSSDRPGGYGGRDLYRVNRLPNGKWSEAQNLGPGINTPFDEDAPFIHPDGKKLFFSSKGHKNMGGYDVFRSDLDSSGKWSMPLNMGYPINSVDDDIYFVINADGTMGYYSSMKPGGEGGTDIYSIKFHVGAFGVQVRNGYLLDKSGEPLKGKVTLFNTTDFKMGGVFKSNGLTGKFIMLLEPDKEYEIVIEVEGYHPHTQTIVYEEGEIRFELIKKE